MFVLQNSLLRECKEKLQTGRVFANCILTKGFYLKYIKISENSVIKKIQFKNGQKNRIHTSSKEKRTESNRCMKRYSTSFVIRKIQVKTTKRYTTAHF